ncbi:MAG: hypothetical protein ACPGR8_16485, partial [Limisphaerales bacterium]
TARCPTFRDHDVMATHGGLRCVSGRAYLFRPTAAQRSGRRSKAVAEAKLSATGAFAAALIFHSQR